MRSMLAAVNQPAGLRQRKKRRTRAALAAAATQLFTQRGYDETTIADLAEVAEVAPRTFYSYFRSKEDVLLVDLDDRLLSLANVVIRLPEETLDDALRRIGTAMVSIVSANSSNPLARVRAQLAVSRPALMGAAFVRLWQAEQQLAQRLQAAFPKELDDILAAAIIGAFMSALRGTSNTSGVNRPTRRRTQTIANRVIGLLEYGLRESRRKGSASA